LGDPIRRQIVAQITAQKELAGLTGLMSTPSRIRRKATVENYAIGHALDLIGALM